MHGKIKEREEGELSSASSPESPIQNGRPSSMVIKKSKTVIPAHLVAEAISTLHGLDLRWSGPITPTEMQYVEQYIFAKYPQYCNGLVDEQQQPKDQDIDLNSPKCPRTLSIGRSEYSSPSSFTTNQSDLDNTQLQSSKLLDIFSQIKSSSSQSDFLSIPEIQARNKALKQCGLSEEDYSIIFLPNYKDAMVMIGESYPFWKGNFYMTIINEEIDSIRNFAARKESKIIAAPETWLDLRIKGSQLSQYFRRKCKNNPKGLFSYPGVVNGRRYSMHWISEAHRNLWHVLVDVTGLVFGEERLWLALHRPDFVVCNVDNINMHDAQTQPSKITCLLVRKKSFDTGMAISP